MNNFIWNFDLESIKNIQKIEEINLMESHAVYFGVMNSINTIIWYTRTYKCYHVVQLNTNNYFTENGSELLNSA